MAAAEDDDLRLPENKGGLAGFDVNELRFATKNAQDILTRRREIWAAKPIIRKLYDRWYGYIQQALKPGRTLELGGGSGNLREFLPEAITSDVVFEPWLDAVLDAHALPFKEESLDNIVLFDVLHHLTAPAVLFREVERVLKSGGRALMMEPYVSWLSFPVYRFLHAEGMEWDTDPFRDQPLKRKGPFEGNQAIPTLIFQKKREKFTEMFSRLRIVREETMDVLLYPLSGGFHQRSFCPLTLWTFLGRLEALLRPLNRYLAFRLFLVLEKR
jgi:SAM-dependent methyltransferase